MRRRDWHFGYDHQQQRIRRLAKTAIETGFQDRPARRQRRDRRLKNGRQQNHFIGYQAYGVTSTDTTITVSP